jgi:hypothetical protein
MVKKSMKGGDGYAVNVLQPIGGRPSFIRYTDNCRPVFQGSLLQNGGEQKGVNEYEKFAVMNSSQMGGGEDCGCGGGDDNIFHLLKENQDKQHGMQQGGFIGTSGLAQFAPIQTLAKVLAPLGVNALTSMIVLIFLHHYVKKKNKMKRGVMMGGFSSSIESVLAPLGRNNLLVLGAILLLHHFASQRYSKVKSLAMMKGGKKRNQKGGSIHTVLGQLLAPLGVNALGASVVVVGLREVFMRKKKLMKGGRRENSFVENMKRMVEKVGIKNLTAKGLMRNLEGLFYKKVKMEDAKMNEKKMKLERYKKDVSEKFHELFDMIGPVTFSTFATNHTLNKTHKIKSYVMKRNAKK